MNKCNVIAIDLAKSVFQVCKTSKDGHVLFNKTMSRNELKEFLIKEKCSLVAMESCAGSHYWSRYAKEAGHEVKAMSARQVRAFRTKQKTDANDALAIAVGARQPHIKACRVISVEEQCLQSQERMRDLLVKQKVALSNQIRGLLLELGFPLPKGDSGLAEKISDILEDAENGLPMAFRSSLSVIWQCFLSTKNKIATLDKALKDSVNKDKQCQRLLSLEGVGPMGAIKLKIALTDTEQFKNGREAAACEGGTPVQHSSGGKEQIDSTSKLTGNKQLRSVLFKGALSVISQLEKRDCRTQKELWLKILVARRGKKVAAIALANKTARTAYVLLKNDVNYQPQTLLAA